MPDNSKHFYDFGPYRVDANERLLRRGDQVVPLTPKAFEMLLVLIEDGGRLLTKEELMKRVWPDTVVEEANLSHNIYKLREALGEGRNGEKYIETVPRRGYRFVGKVTALQKEPDQLLVAEHSRAQIVVEEDDSFGEQPAAYSPEKKHIGRPIYAEGQLPRKQLLLAASAVVIIG